MKNEEDIIERFIRVNGKIFDHFQIVDNGSTDRTLEILAGLKKEFNIFVTKEHGDTYNQTYVINQAIHDLLVFNHFDWYIPLDADEFIQCSRSDLEKALNRVPENMVPKFFWRNWLPKADGGWDPHLFRGAPAVGKVAIRASQSKVGIRITQGNHEAVDPELNFIEEFDTGIDLDHYPVRSVEQIKQKVFATEQRHNRTMPGYITHIHRIADYFRARAELTNDDLRQIAAYYTFIQHGIPNEDRKLTCTKLSIESIPIINNRSKEE